MCQTAAVRREPNPRHVEAVLLKPSTLPARLSDGVDWPNHRRFFFRFNSNSYIYDLIHSYIIAQFIMGLKKFYSICIRLPPKMLYLVTVPSHMSWKIFNWLSTTIENMYFSYGYSIDTMAHGKLVAHEKACFWLQLWCMALRNFSNGKILIKDIFFYQGSKPTWAAHRAPLV